MKKIFNLITSSVAFTLLVATSTGCLKDKYVEDGLAGPRISESPRLIELAGSVVATTSYNSSSIVSLNSGNADTTFNLVPVRLASNQPASEDIQVELELVPSLIEAYNDSTGAHVISPASNLYSLPNSLVVTIPKGEREGFLQMKAKPNDLVGGEYGFGLRIKSVSNPDYRVSGNFGNSVVLVGVKNKYHGTYTSTGYVYHPSAPRDVYMEKEVTTAGSNSVFIDLGDLGGAGYRAKVTIDEATNLLTIEAAPGAAGAPYTMFTAGLPTTNPGYTAGWPGSSAQYNRYDPATQTFYVRYGYMGGTGWRVTEEQIKRN